MTTTLPQIPEQTNEHRQQVVETIWELSTKVSGFSDDRELFRLVSHMIDGLFKKRGNGLRKNPESWQGYKRRDGSIDEKSLAQSARNAFTMIFHYHCGRNNAYLGTIINSTDKMAMICEAYIVGEQTDAVSRMLPVNSPEKRNRLNDLRAALIWYRQKHKVTGAMRSLSHLI